MDWTNELLKELTNLAELPNLSDREIAVILGIDSDAFIANIDDRSTEASRAYSLGKLKAKAELGKRIQTMSKQGSGPAQTLERKMRLETEVKNTLERYE